MIVVLADFKCLAESQCSQSLVRWSNSSGAPTQTPDEHRNLFRSYEDLGNGKQSVNNQYDHQRGGTSLEKHERLNLGLRGAILVDLRVKTVKLQTGQHRAKLTYAWEGVTTRAKARRAKWLEAPGTAYAVEEIVSSAWEHAAA